MNEFFAKVWVVIQAVWIKVKGSPIIKPLWALVYSRKATIAAAVITWLLTVFPSLVPAKDQLLGLMVQVVGIILIAVATQAGIVIEDKAKLENGITPGTPDTVTLTAGAIEAFTGQDYDPGFYRVAENDPVDNKG